MAISPLPDEPAKVIILSTQMLHVLGSLRTAVAYATQTRAGTFALFRHFA